MAGHGMKDKGNNDPLSFDNVLKPYSIARRLTINLIVTVLTVALVVSALLYFYSVRKAELDLETRADEMLIFLTGSLEIPLWDLDDNQVSAIVKTFAQDDLVSEVTIMNRSGKIFYSIKKELESERIHREGELRHNNELIGSIRLVLTKHYAHANSRYLLLSLALTIAFILLSLIFVTGMLVKYNLRTPLKRLNSIADSFASSGYHSRDTSLPYIEFQPLGKVLAEMVETINHQMEDLQKSEKRYRQLIEQAADGIFVTDTDGSFLVVNSKACDLLGYTADEVHQLNILDTYPEEIRDIGRQRLAQLQSGESLRFERPMKRKDGTVFLVEASASKLEDGRMQAIIHDITDRKQAEDEKRRLEFKLAHAQKIESIGTFAGGIAHDFNNILSAIIGYAELATREISDPAKVQDNLKGVLKAGNRAKELVSKIITFSKHSETKCVPIMLNSTINDSFKLLRPIIPTSVEIRQKHLSPGLVMADPAQIHRVIMNLCSNAAQAMGQTGGVLEVSLEKVNIAEGEEASDPYLISGPYLRLTISDTGQGMTPAVRERIFDPYFTTREPGRGSGLGLSVVQGIVKKHRGVITCKSRPGEGTTFDIYFPEIDSREKSVKCLTDVEPHMEISNSTGTERILFIDDDSTLSYLASELLGGLGYEVVTQTSSIEALNLFKENPDKFDLVITDMTMPVMTGDSLAQKILEIRSDIPIILCTGYSEYISKEKAESIGIREFIMKPFEMKDMAVTIRKVLDRE